MAADDRIPSGIRISTADSIPADRLGIANTVGILVWVFSISALIFLGLDSSFKSSANQDESLRLVRALDLGSLALVPSGRPLRYPGSDNQATDLQFDPALGPIYFDDVELVLKPPDFSLK